MRTTVYLSVALAVGAVEAAAPPAGSSLVERAFAYARLSPVADRPVLTDERLPGFAFADPAEARRILGAYRLRVTVYDASYRPVTRAVAPGRYGAVVEVNPGTGSGLPTTRRFVTLYRLPTAARIGDQSPALVARLRALRWDFKTPPEDSALTLAALHEVPPGDDPAGFYHQPAERDRSWWTGLKRRLYGYDRHPRFAVPFRAALPLDGDPAPVIRDGTPAEAGVKPDAARRIDEVLRRWADDTTDGFDVCIVRHGVVVLRRSYGRHRGKPVTAATAFPLASTSKFITGLMLMMAVDRGAIDLDTPVTEMPGPLYGLKTEKPITVRALYTHTAFTDPAGLYPTPDLEERLAAVLPHLSIGRGFAYTGMSLELAWALTSTATGQSISTFARDHLLRPLGCRHTEVFNSGGATTSTAHDLACILQMVLNRGAYGGQRFLGAGGVEAMLPRRLTKTLGRFTNDRPWGIGTMPWKVNGLSDFTFGHKGYFRSTAFIDPVNDLVVVMLRVDPPLGRKYDRYHPAFLDAVVAGLTDPVPAFPEGLRLTALDLPPGTDRAVIEAVVDNPGPTPAVLEYRYETAGTGWRVEPATARVRVPARSRVPVRVVARVDPGRLAPLPRLRGAVHAEPGPAPPSPHVEYGLRPLLRRAVTAAPAGCPAGDRPFLLETHGRKDPRHPTRFWVTYDDAALRVTVEADEPDGPASRAARRDDPALRTGEYVEVVVRPTDDRSRRQFAVDLRGGRYDALDGDAGWDGRWTAAVRPGEHGFVVEFTIPYAALGARPRPGDRWGLNVLRGRGAAAPRWEAYSQWVMTYADFNSRTHLGELRFGAPTR